MARNKTELKNLLNSTKVTVGNLLTSLIGSVSASREAHLTLSSYHRGDTEQKLGVIDHEIVDEAGNMLLYGICHVFDITEETLKGLMGKEINKLHVIVSLIEDSIYNQRLTYNPSNLTWKSNYEVNAIALNGSNLSTYLYLLAVFPGLKKLTIDLVLKNIDKGKTKTDTRWNTILLLEEIANNVVSEPMRLITSVLDKIFDCKGDFMEGILSKQVIRVDCDGSFISLTLKGDHRVVILDRLVKGLHMYEDQEDLFNEGKSTSIKDLICRVVPELDIKLLENYIKQSFHSFSKKK